MRTPELPIEQTNEFRMLLRNIEAIDDVRLIEAIPKELFQPKVWRGMLGALVSACVYIGALVGVAYAPHWLLILPLWLVAGLGAWGLFCINHDCGHSSFSRSPTLNSFVGHIVVLPLLFPHHGWRHMHNLHHLHANCLELDPDWRPRTRAELKHVTLWDRLMYLTSRGWFWWIGTVNYQYHCCRPGFLPKREARKEATRSLVIVGLFAAVYLPALVYFTGPVGLVLYFLGPWLAFHAWFSTTTLMHHTTPELPFLPIKYWTRNASRLLLTTDYNYPKWLHFLTHNISVHTAHHVAPIMPFYNLPRAREALKRAYPGMVREKKLSFHQLFEIVRKCHFYDPVHGYYLTHHEERRTRSGEPQHVSL
ncbi:MAG: fatty acid desaturase [Gammaproteobacteria bacterium]|nr:fatty acid desaturase [Gammaproteobacteria bacterium]